MRNYLWNSRKIYIKNLFICLLLYYVPLLSTGQHVGFADTLFVKRLNNLNLEIEIPYSDIVGDNIALLTHQKIKYTAQALGIFFAEQDDIVSVIKSAHLPTELQYLPLALTQMKITFQDKFHCAGIWQLPYFVAVNYGLTVNDEIDERYDVKKSTTVAVAYLKKLSENYTDFWDLIIAYANSPAALEAAKIRVRHCQTDNNVWSLYALGNLSHKDIIPDFITYLYLANFYQVHQIKPVAPKIDKDSTQVYLQKSVSKDKFISTEYNTEKTILATSSKQSISPSQTKPIYYTVKSGDVLSKLAIKYNTNVSQLKKWNNLKNDNIYIGQRLIVRQERNSQKTIYTIKSGDTLSKIAKMYNVTIKDIKQWNKLKNDTIYAGQQLIMQ